MSDELYELAWINFTKAILHGFASNVEFEIVLTDAERDLVYDINERHDDEMKRLLRGIKQSREAA